MKFHREDNIRLQEAMTKQSEYLIQVWSVQGLQIEVKGIGENTIIQTTLVYKDSCGMFDLEIMGYFDGEAESYSRRIDEFSSLDELKEKYPHLFEMNGYLFELG